MRSVDEAVNLGGKAYVGIEPVTELFGVKAPEWLKLFDCRHDVMMRDPSGHATVYASEAAEYALGLRSYERGEYFGTTPSSLQAYWDFRQKDERTYAEAARCIQRQVERAIEMQAKYDSVKADPENVKGEFGGSCYFRIVAVALSNFGVCVIADRRDLVCEYFKP